MIDITGVQIEAIPPSIKSLQIANDALTIENTRIKKEALIGLGILIAGVILVIIIKQIQDERKTDRTDRSDF